MSTILKTPTRPLTVHDFQELPEGPPHYQLIQGDLLMSPSPNRYHQQILTNVASVLLAYLERKRIGKIYFAPCDVFLTELDVYQPDLLFISNERSSILGEQGIDGAPDLVVEILSPKTARLDKGVKKEVYARTGVRELWIIDPDQHQIIVYDLQKSSTLPSGTYGASQGFSSRMFPGLKIQVKKLFA